MNNLFKSNKDCTIKCWNEKTSVWDKIEFITTNGGKEVEINLDISGNEIELIDVFWEAG